MSSRLDKVRKYMARLLIFCTAASNFPAAVSSPSLLIITALFSRSASACRAITRFMSSGNSTFWRFTEIMSTPQSWVSRSTIFSILLAISSRLASNSSSSTLPTTSRIVVWAYFITLFHTFWMLTRLSFVFITFMNTTASMLTLMLSLVITSCRATSNVIIRLSCFRKLSANGHLKKNPGPTSL